MGDQAAVREQLAQRIREMQASTLAVDQAARDGLGVNATYLRLLGVLQLRGPHSPSALAEAVGITPASTTVAVDRLSERDLVTRSRHPHDKRRSVITLTPACSQWLERAYGPLRTEGSALLASFSDDEIELIDTFVTASIELQGRRAAAIDDQQRFAPTSKDVGKEPLTERASDTSLKTPRDTDTEQ